MTDRPDYVALMATAREARLQAYAPYSNFPVGAAVLTASGNVYRGCNIENAAYSPCICAERVALFSAYAAGERDIAAIAVVTETAGPASPCGPCRQVIAELAPNAVLLLTNLHGDVMRTTPDALLPHGFGLSQLEEAKKEQHAGRD